MRVLTIVLAAALAAAGAADAGQRVSDSDYLQMSRCAGLTDGARGDSTAYDQALRRFSRGRDSRVRDRAQSRRRAASLDMRSASGEALQRLQAELATRCAVPG